DRLLSSADGPARAVLAGLRRHGLPARADKAALLFGRDSAPGESVNLTVERDVTCVFHAPGAAMAAFDQNPPTQLMGVVRRARPTDSVEPPLPEPLADPIQDMRVDRRTARGYLVKEGEYIQVIDVFGRQCSDFVALDARKLEQGVERGFDMTATRTMTGLLYPVPGLFG